MTVAAMIVVDSSVWIDYFNGQTTPETDFLDELLGTPQVLMGDVILTEILQGFRSDRDYEKAKSLLTALPMDAMWGREIALQSAANYRKLKNKGFTIRKTVDLVIGTFCIENHHALLHVDRDFTPMEKYLGLEVVHPPVRALH